MTKLGISYINENHFVIGLPSKADKVHILPKTENDPNDQQWPAWQVDGCILIFTHSDFMTPLDGVLVIGPDDKRHDVTSRLIKYMAEMEDAEESIGVTDLEMIHGWVLQQYLNALDGKDLND